LPDHEVLSWLIANGGDHLTAQQGSGVEILLGAVVESKHNIKPVETLGGAAVEFAAALHAVRQAADGRVLG
jgi:hypothetical protein